MRLDPFEITEKKYQSAGVEVCKELAFEPTLCTGWKLNYSQGRCYKDSRSELGFAGFHPRLTVRPDLRAAGNSHLGRSWIRGCQGRMQISWPGRLPGHCTRRGRRRGAHRARPRRARLARARARRRPWRWRAKPCSPSPQMARARGGKSGEAVRSERALYRT